MIMFTNWLLLNESFQNRDDARQYMKFLHPDLGVGNETEIISQIPNLDKNFTWCKLIFALISL
jgi:hypothetical protein